MKVPEGWAWKTVSDFISHLDAGVSVNGEDNPASSHELGVLKVSAVTEGVFRAEENKKILDSEIGRARVNPKAGKILMSRANSLDLIGASAYVPHDYPNLFLSDKLWQLEPVGDSNVDMKWLHLVISSPAYRRKISAMATGTSMSMKNISKDVVFSLPLMVPPLPEQKAISDTLSTWDTAIETMEWLIAAKEKAFIASLDALAFKSRNDGWRLVALGEAFQERSETGREDLPLLSISRDTGVTTREETNRKDTSSEDKSKYLRICPGDIGYNTMRMWQGVSALSCLEGIVSPAYTICIPNETLILGEFAAYLFKHPWVVHQFYRHSQGLTSDTWNLKFPHFAEIHVWLPGVDQQRHIVNGLHMTNKEISLLRMQLELLQRQKRALMQKLLTGTWRVRVPE